MHAHRVQILDRADDDAVAGAVAHDLHLVLFPALDALLHQHLGYRGEVKALGNDELKLVFVVGDAAAGAAKRERRTDDHRVAKAANQIKRVIDRIGIPAAGNLQADLGHGLVELLAIFTALDGGQVAADHLHVVLVQHTGLGKLDRGIERGLAAKGGKQRVGALLGDDLLDKFLGDGLDVGAIDQLRVGHDGCRVGVHQNNLEPVFLQHLARLGARIVEFARLADDDRARADYEDALDVGTLRHVPLLPQPRRPNRKGGRRRCRYRDNPRRRPSGG